MLQFKYNFLDVYKDQYVNNDNFRLEIFNNFYQCITFIMIYNSTMNNFFGSALGTSITLNKNLEGTLYNTINNSTFSWNITWFDNTHLQPEIPFDNFSIFNPNYVFNKNIELKLNYYVNDLDSSKLAELNIKAHIIYLQKIFKKINFRIKLNNIFYIKIFNDSIIVSNNPLDVVFKINTTHNFTLLNDFNVVTPDTEINILYSNNSDSNAIRILGKSTIKSICNNSNLILYKSNIQTEAITIAHEIGHILGFNHKEYFVKYSNGEIRYQQCYCKMKNCIMDETFKMFNTAWSNCNYYYLVDSDLNCLLKE